MKLLPSKSNGELPFKGQRRVKKTIPFLVVDEWTGGVVPSLSGSTVYELLYFSPLIIINNSCTMHLRTRIRKVYIIRYTYINVCMCAVTPLYSTMIRVRGFLIYF